MTAKAHVHNEALLAALASEVGLEMWKPLRDYEDLYEISNHGRVRSKARPTTPGGLLKPGKSSYLNFTACKNGKPVCKLIHVEVVRTFIGDIPDKMVVMHLNSEPYDNRLINLQIGTYAENNAETKKLGRNRRCASDEVVEQIKRMRSQGLTRRQISNALHISRSTISKITNNQGAYA